MTRLQLLYNSEKVNRNLFCHLITSKRCCLSLNDTCLLYPALVYFLSVLLCFVFLSLNNVPTFKDKSCFVSEVSETINNASSSRLVSTYALERNRVHYDHFCSTTACCAAFERGSTSVQIATELF